MFKLTSDSHPSRTLTTGIGILAVGAVAAIFSLGFCSSASTVRVASPTSALSSSTAVASPISLPLQPTVLPDLSAKGVTLPKEMTLYRARPSDITAAIPNADAVASAQAFYPFAHLGEARLLLMTDDQNPRPRLVWIVTVLDRPTFQGGPAGAGADATRPWYNLVFVDATSGKAMFGQSGEKVN